MKYRIYKFDFLTGVHFGKKALDEAEYSFGADTLFSALCQEYLKQGQEYLADFVRKTKEGKLWISDAFPYIGNTYYLPKPMMKIQTEQKSGDSIKKKAYKKLTYVPTELLEQYINGNLEVEEQVKKFRKELGSKIVKVSASVRGEEETVPYRVGVYYFNAGSGLYIIVGYENDSDLASMEECLEALSYTGIGGKRSSGLGRFQLRTGKMPESLWKRLQNVNGSVYMTLSGSLPLEEELEKALEEANYLLVKRSGFVASDSYAKEQMRKRNLYVMKAGSCFTTTFTGDVYDVSDGGNHPVYRYAKPMFLEVIS